MSADKTQITDLVKDEVNYHHLETTRAIIGAAYEVHRELGPGFLEKVYETALVQELTSRGVPVRCQAEIRVRYKGQEVGVYYAAVLVDDNVVCEIKAVESLSSEIGRASCR